MMQGFPVTRSWRRMFWRGLGAVVALASVSAFAQQAVDSTSVDSLSDLLGTISQVPAAPAESKAEDSAASPVPAANQPQDAAANHDDEVLPTVPVTVTPTSVHVADKAPQAGIEEIVVTATKREESLRDIPASIAAVTGEALEKSGVQSVQDIVKLVPGVNITNDGVNAAQITIRGIASVAGTNPTTGLLFGDVAFTDFYVPRVTLDPNPFDLKSVEVLKGPQGTLFGAGALNGAIRYVPEGPKFGEWETKYFVQYQKITHGASAPTYGVAQNIPIGSSDQLALRVMAFDRTTPGYIDDLGINKRDANELDQHGLRGILGWQPSEDWNLALTYATQRSKILDSAQADNANGNLSRSNTPNASPSNNRYQLADLKANYKFDSAQFVSETAYVEKNSYAHLDIQRTLYGLIPASRVEAGRSTTISQELRLQSDDDSDWQWVGGVSGLRQKFKFALDVPIGSAITPVSTLLPLLEPLLPGISTAQTGNGYLDLLSVHADATVQEVALFGDMTWHFLDDWALSVGGRFYRTSSGGPVTQGGAILVPTNLAFSSVNRDIVHEKGFNPKVSLSWYMTEDLMAYTTVSRGFRVGGTQIGATTVFTQTKAPPVFKSDTIWNYEAGMRTTWLDNTLHFDFTGFHSVWKDPQAVLPDSTGLIVYYDNVGGVVSNGIEATFEYQLPFGGLTFGSSAAYTNTYTTAPYVAPDGTNLPPGQTWPLSPKWQTATTLSQNSEWGNWNVGVGVTHTFLGQAINNLARRQNVFGYRLLDAQINLANTANPWIPSIALIAGNILDGRGKTNVDNSPEDVVYVQPRSFTIRLSGKF